MVGNVKNVDAVPAECERDPDLETPETIVFRDFDQLKPIGQWAELVKVFSRPQQEIRTVGINSRQRPNEIPDMGSDPEFVDSSNVDRDAHVFP
jgi:hypothetical protein